MPPRWLKTLRLLAALTAGSLVALPLGAWLFFASSLGTPLVNREIARHLKGILQGEVRFGSASTNLFTSITLRDLLILSDNQGLKLPVATADKVSIRFHLWGLLRGRISPREDVELIRVEGLKVFALRDPQGGFNMLSLLKPGALAPRPGAAAGGSAPLLPLTRIELADAEVVFSDQQRGFRALLEGLNGELDTRQAPLIKFSLRGRSEESPRDNLALSGSADMAAHRLHAQLDLRQVPLERYLNYAVRLPALRFLAGSADLRLQADLGQHELKSSGRARLSGGRVKVAGIAAPLSGLGGEIAFDADRIEFKRAQAVFLGSPWNISGELTGLEHPTLSLALSNPVLDLASLAREVRGLSRTALSGTAALSVSVSGSILSPRVEGWVRCPQAQAYGQRVDDLSAGLSIAHGALRLDGLQGSIQGGLLQGQGEYRFAGPGLPPGGRLDCQAVLRGFQLAKALGPWAGRVPLDGSGDAELSLRGPAAAPRLDMSAHMASSTLAGQPMGPLELRGSLASRRLEASLDGWRGGISAMGILDLGKEPVLECLDLALVRLPLKGLLASLGQEGARLPPSAAKALALLGPGFDGFLSLSLSAQGLLKDPEMRARLSLDEGRWAIAGGEAETRDGQPLELEASLALGLMGHRLSLGGPQGFARLFAGWRHKGLELKAKGEMDARGPLTGDALGLELQGDLAGLMALRMVDTAQGRVQGQLALSFEQGQWQAEGGLLASSMGARLSKYCSALEHGSLDLAFHGRQVLVKDCFIRCGGTVKGEGELRLGLDGLQGSLSLSTAEGGILLDRWDEVVNGYVELDPLTVELGGPSQPSRLSGRILLHDATLSWGGSGQGSAGPPSALLLDLRLGLGDRVWYRKGVDDGMPDLNLDLAHSAQELLDSYEGTFRKPTFDLQFKPTADDLRLQGPLSDLSLAGSLEVQRGTMNLLNNDFQLKSGELVFQGIPGAPPQRRRRGDLSALAVTKVVAPGHQGRPPRTYWITVQAQPLADEQLEALGWPKVFINYFLSFTSSPPVTFTGDEASRDEQKETSAIASLLVLGDDLGLAADPSAPPGLAAAPSDFDASGFLANQGLRYLATMAGRFVSKGAHSMASSLVDYFRFSPRFDYGGGASAPVASGSQAPSSTGSAVRFKDVSLEVGKDITEKLYLTVQGVFFNEVDYSEAQLYATGVDDTNLVWPSYGGRVGLEYNMGRNRQLVSSVGYNVDDRLEPRPRVAGQDYQAADFYLGLQGSVYSSAYSPSEARRRARDAHAAQGRF